MSTQEKMIQFEKEQEVWIVFKKAVEQCKQLQFSEKQLVSYIQIKYYDYNIKGEIKESEA